MYDCMLMDSLLAAHYLLSRLNDEIQPQIICVWGEKKNVLTPFLLFFFYPRLIPQGITVKSRVRIISAWFLWLCALKHDASPADLLMCAPNALLAWINGFARTTGIQHS